MRQTLSADLPRRAARSLISTALATGVLLAAPASSIGPLGLDAQTTTPTLWLAPASVPARQPLAEALVELTADNAAKALPVFSRAINDPQLGGYALLYVGRAQLALQRPADAARTAGQLLSRRPSGHLATSAIWLAADAAEAAGDSAGAARTLRQLRDAPPLSPEKVLLRLGRISPDRAERVEALTRVYLDYPLTPEAVDATSELTTLGALKGLARPELYAANRARAERLFAAKRYTDARATFDLLRGQATGDEASLIELRLAQCDYHLKRYPQARTALTAYLARPRPAHAEARYFFLGTLRVLGRADDYVREVRAFAESGADPVFVEAALNDLGTFHILADEDEKAAGVFAEMNRRFPAGANAPRAAWRSGWWAYRHDRFGEAAQIFSTAALTHRRSDYRPAWLYWTARAQAELGRRAEAIAGHEAVIADYRNSFYGRQASRDLATLQRALRTSTAAAPRPSGSRDLISRLTPGEPPVNAALVRALLAAGLYDDAIGELRTVQAVSGSTPLIEATIAYALNRRGDLRLGITAMRRAYPQFMADGGEALPSELLGIIFPLAYWELIVKHAPARGLDPYLVAALMAQESTFDAGIQSSANAWGLMQILPSTGARYARSLGIRPFSTARLTDPEVNVRIGVSYFADLVEQFGDVVPALAAYNAGENRVVRWLAERPGLDRQEFIDDIPFPETQNYVKRIVGTAEDYRRLYAKAAPGVGESPAIR